MNKIKISPKLIMNVLVVGLCLGIAGFFFFSEGGLYDILNSDINVIWYWVVAAVGAQLAYMMLETVVIYIFVKDEHKRFSFMDAMKVSFLGLFWSAVTPSSTGGQPMQIYLMYSMGISVGYSTSRLMQKFLIYQVVLTSVSIVSVIINFDFVIHSENSTLLIILVIFGFVSQFLVTAVFLLFSFSPNLSRKLIMLCARLLQKIRIIKNVDEKVKSIDKQLTTFHTSNKDIYKKPKLIIVGTVLTFFQFIAMFLVPYYLYRAFGFSEASPVDLISCQAFVNLMSGMIPIPGSSGAAELGFTAFFGAYFGETLKGAALIWRVINYYGVVLLTAPFAYITKSKTDEAKKADIDVSF